jgi:glycosyltransferase involved in cell wall biosynthesis
MLSQTFAPVVGGVERMVEDLCSELSRRGHEVAVATLGHPDINRNGSGGDVSVHELRSTSYRLPAVHADAERRHASPAPDPETVAGLRRVLRDERPDAVHAHDWIVHSYLPLARSVRAPLLHSLHDYGLICPTKRLMHLGQEPCSGPGPVKCVVCAGDYYGRVKGPAIATSMKATSRWLRRRVDLFLPVSEAVRDLSRLEASDRHRVIPNFIRELPPSPEGDARLAELPQRPYIVFCGDATADKGALTLARAHARLEDPPPLVFVGRSFLAELGEQPGIVQVGPWPHDLTIEAVRRSALAVVPSVMPETFGLAALEAAATGRPVIASRIGGLPGIVADGETGVLVPPGDDAALAQAIRTLIDDPQARERMGEAARQRSLTYSADAIVPRFEEAYRDAIEARGAGA